MFSFASLITWLRDPIPRMLLGSGIVALMVAAWMLFGGGADNSALKKKLASRLLRCPNCDLVTIYNPNLVDQACMKCRKARLVVASSNNESESSELSSLNRAFILGFVGLVIAQGIVYAWAIRFGARPEDPTVDLIRCRCPACKRKFAYRASSAKTRTRCTRCKSEFELPEPSNPI